MFINVFFFRRKKMRRPAAVKPTHTAHRPASRPAPLPDADTRFSRRLYRVLGSLALTALLLCAAFALFDKPVIGCRAEDFAPLAAPTAAGDGTASSASDEEKVVYLTFDDGPSQNTEAILDTLKEAGVPATFFVIAAEHNEEYLPLLERTMAEGHCIGLHTCTHDYRKIYANAEAFWADIDALKQKLQPYCGQKEYGILRFPGGSANTVSHKYGGSGLMDELIAQAKEQGYAVVDWNVSAEDSVGGHPSAATLAGRVIRGCKEHTNAVVLMHDSSTNKATAEALPTVIQWLKENHYRFDTADHLPTA